MIYDMI